MNGKIEAHWASDAERKAFMARMRKESNKKMRAAAIMFILAMIASSFIK